MDILLGELLDPVHRAAAAGAAGRGQAAGFDAVEFWWPFARPVPADQEVDAFVAAVQDAGVQLVGLNFFAGDMPGGDRGLVSWPGADGEFRDNVDVTVGIGERLGVHGVQRALRQPRRRTLDPPSRTSSRVENLALAAGQPPGSAATVLVEPVSGAPRYPLLTAADALAVIDRVRGEPNVRPARRPLPPVGQRRRRRRGHRRSRRPIGHVQIADAPAAASPAPARCRSAASSPTSTRPATTAGSASSTSPPTAPSAASFDWLPPTSDAKEISA